MLTICGTGHRPNKLGGYDNMLRVVELASACLVRFEPDLVISGMALGWDNALAVAAVQMNIPFVAMIPFVGQELRWTSQMQAEYHGLLDLAVNVEVVSAGGYSPQSMQKRNEAMVDAADWVLALWNGSAGGTANCVRYATQVGKPIRNVWSSWVKYHWRDK